MLILVISPNPGDVKQAPVVDLLISQMIYSIMPYSVVLLQSALDFIDGLPGKMRAKAYRSISLLREFGPYLREPHSKPVVGWKSLMELRVRFATDICRLFYFRHPADQYVVVSGYIKKGMKLDRNELQRAFRLMKEALEEKGD